MLNIASLLIVVLFAVLLVSSSCTSVIIVLVGWGSLVVLACRCGPRHTCLDFRKVIHRQFLAKVHGDLPDRRWLFPNRLHFEPLHGILHVAHVTGGWLEVLGTTLACNFEPVDFGLVVVDFRGQDHRHRIVHEEHLREASPEARPIHINLSSLGQVNFLASGAKVLEARCLESVREADRNDFLAVAERSRTRPIDSIQKLLVHFGQASGGQRVACMD